MRRRKRACLAALLALLTACTPLYLPPVPEGEPVTIRESLELRGAPGLRRASEGGLELRLRLLRVPEAGWLELQWFAPDNQQVASDAAWLGPADADTELSLFLPGEAELAPGQWRAVVSFGGMLVRQFTLELPSLE